MWYPQTQREVSDGIGCRIQIKTHMVRGKIMNKKGSFKVFPGPQICSPSLVLDFKFLHLP